MRPRLRQHRSRHIAEQPNQPLRSIRRSNCGKRLALHVEPHTRQRKLWRPLRQMLQRPALHINKRPFPRRVHHLQHKPILCIGKWDSRFPLSSAQLVQRSPVQRCKVEIIVVLARKRLGGHFQSIQFPSEPYRFRLRSRPRNPLFQQHPEILSATPRAVHSHGVRRSCRRF